MCAFEEYVEQDQEEFVEMEYPPKGSTPVPVLAPDYYTSLPPGPLTVLGSSSTFVGNEYNGRERDRLLVVDNQGRLWYCAPYDVHQYAYKSKLVDGGHPQCMNMEWFMKWFTNEMTPNRRGEVLQGDWETHPYHGVRL